MDENQPVESLKDQFLEMFPAPAREILEKHLREILAAVSVVVIAVALWSGYKAYSDYKEHQAATAIGAALAEPEPTKRAERLEDVVKDQRHTEARRQALLLLGATWREQGETRKAEEMFQEARKEFPKGSALRESATMGLGYLREDKKALKQAQDCFQEASKSEAGYEAVALLDLARVSSALGDKEQAKDAYNEYIAQRPESQDLDYVRWLLSRAE